MLPSIFLQANNHYRKQLALIQLTPCLVWPTPIAWLCTSLAKNQHNNTRQAGPSCRFQHKGKQGRCRFLDCIVTDLCRVLHCCRFLYFSFNLSHAATFLFKELFTIQLMRSNSTNQFTRKCSIIHLFILFCDTIFQGDLGEKQNCRNLNIYNYFSRYITIPFVHLMT